MNPDTQRESPRGPATIQSAPDLALRPPNAEPHIESPLRGLLSAERVVLRFPQKQYGELLGVSPDGMLAAYFREDDGATLWSSRREPGLDIAGSHVGATLHAADFLPGTVNLFSLSEKQTGQPVPLKSFRFNHHRNHGITILTPLSDGERVLVSQSNGRPAKASFATAYELCRIQPGSGCQELVIEGTFASRALNPVVAINRSESEILIHGTGIATPLHALLSSGSEQDASLNILERHSLDSRHPGRILSEAIAGLGRNDPGHSNAVGISPDGAFAVSGVIGGVEYYDLLKRRSRGAIIGDIRLPDDAGVKQLQFNDAGTRLAVAYNRIVDSSDKRHPIVIYEIDRSRDVPHFIKERELDSIYLSNCGRLSFVPGGDLLVVGGFMETVITSINHSDLSTELTLGRCDLSSGRMNAEGNVVASGGELLVFKTQLNG